MKILLIGNCQIESIAACCAALFRSADIKRLYIWDLRKRGWSLPQFLEEIKSFDIVLSHRIYDWGVSDFDELVAKSNVIEMPSIVFSAFHPDCGYMIDDENGKLVKSPIGDYGSIVIAYLYSQGASEAKAIELMNDNVCLAAGYLDRWKTSIDALAGEFRRCGLTLGNLPVRWVAAGPFMHSINHPRLQVIADCVGAVLRKANVKVTSVPNISYVLPDPLLHHSSWPVYGEIARYYGFESGPEFFKGVAPGGRFELFSLVEFVQKSFEIYRNQGVKRFRSPLHSAWQQSGIFEC